MKTLIVMFALSFIPEVQPGDIDLIFNVAQEEFVIDTGTVGQLEQMVSHKEAVLIRRLGCKHYECREDVEQHIFDLGHSALRALMIGRKHKDPEIAHRCEKLLNMMFICPDCDNGRIFCCDKGKKHMQYSNVCKRCAGLVDIRIAVSCHLLHKEQWQFKSEQILKEMGGGF